MLYLNNDAQSDQRLYCSLIESITSIVAIPEISGLYLASMAVQTDLSLSWSAYTAEDRFSHDVAQL